MKPEKTARAVIGRIMLDRLRRLASERGLDVFVDERVPRRALAEARLYLLKGVGGDDARVARGAFREVVPVHRLSYTFGWEGGQEVPPGSGLIEIDLIERDGGTLLRMTHSGLPNEAQCVSHNRGWAYYLGRLALAAGGQNPGIDRGPP